MFCVCGFSFFGLVRLQVCSCREKGIRERQAESGMLSEVTSEVGVAKRQRT